jgi:hypothetical protein
MDGTLRPMTGRRCPGEFDIAALQIHDRLQNVEVGQSLGVNGTPTLVFTNGPAKN